MKIDNFKFERLYQSAVQCTKTHKKLIFAISAVVIAILAGTAFMVGEQKEMADPTHGAMGDPEDIRVCSDFVQGKVIIEKGKLPDIPLVPLRWGERKGQVFIEHECPFLQAGDFHLRSAWKNNMPYLANNDVPFLKCEMTLSKRGKQRMGSTLKQLRTSRVFEESIPPESLWFVFENRKFRKLSVIGLGANLR